METNKQKDDVTEIDLVEIFHVLMGRIWILLIFAVICGVLTGLVTKLCVAPKYQSTTKIYVLSKGSDSGSGGISSALTSLTDLQLGSQLLVDYQSMMLCRPVMEQVIKNLELDMDYKTLTDLISVDSPENSRILDITVTYTDPYIAKQIADETARVSSTYCSKIMDIEEPPIFEEAETAKQKSSPSTGKNSAIGAILGLLAAAAVVIVRFLMNDTIQSEEDVEKYLGLNSLGIIPLQEKEISQVKKDKRKRRRELRS